MELELFYHFLEEGDGEEPVVRVLRDELRGSRDDHVRQLFVPTLPVVEIIPIQKLTGVKGEY